MRKKPNTFFSLCSLTLVGMLIIPTLVTAQDSGSIVVDPIKETIETQAGETKQTTLKITNNTADEKQVTIGFEEFTVNESGVPTAIDASEADPSSWFAADPNQTTIAAGETKEISVTVTVPSTATEKGYYVMSSIKVGNTEQEAASNETKQEIQSLYSIVIGSPEAKLEIESIYSVDDQVVLVVTNSSDVHSAVSGKLDLLKNDEIAETYSIDSVNVFPGKSRNITVTTDGLTLADYTAKASLAYDNGDGNQVITYEQDLSAATTTSDDSSQVARVKNTATIVSDDNKLDSQDLLIYGLLGFGAVLVGAGVFLTLKKR